MCRNEPKSVSIFSPSKGSFEKCEKLYPLLDFVGVYLLSEIPSKRIQIEFFFKGSFLGILRGYFLWLLCPTVSWGMLQLTNHKQVNDSIITESFSLKVIFFKEED